MSPPPPWNPCNHPVHRLLQFLDTAVAAAARVRVHARELMLLVGDGAVWWDGPLQDGKARFRALIDEYRAVYFALFVQDNFDAGEVARQLKNDVIAYFIRHNRPEAVGPVAEACEWLESFPGDPPLAALDTAAPDSPADVRKRNIHEIRSALIAELSYLGEAIPAEIDQRIKRRIDSVPFGVGSYPSLTELKRWAEETRTPPANTELKGEVSRLTPTEERQTDVGPPIDDESRSGAARPFKLAPSRLKAYEDYLRVQKDVPELRNATYEAIYTHLKENGAELPSLASWKQYITDAKKVVAPGIIPVADRPTGKSVVSHRDV